MLDRFLLGHAIDRGKLLVADVGGVRLEGVQVRYVPLDEELQKPPVHELVGIGDDGGQEPLVLLVTAELCLAVLGSGDDDRIEVKSVLKDVHLRPEPQLPPAVLHGLWDGDLELDVHASVPLCHVAEPGCHYGRINHVVSDHLSVLVLDGLHDEHLAVAVPDDERVPLGYHVLADVRDVVLLSCEGQGWTDRTALQALHLALRGASCN